ncbi:MAG: cell surface protein SprA [Muribaculaceae bacterium]|nr:cell surface protein SprA [Muribaculaceae bacterium]
MCFQAGYAQSKTTGEQQKSPPPPARPDGVTNKWTKDSMNLRFDVTDKLSQSYSDLQFVQNPTDLKNPSNLTTTAEFDYETGHYVIHTKVGDNDIMTPFLLSPEEYENIALRQSMQEYYRQKNAESAEQKKDQPFNFLDMQFGLGPLESVFGPGGVQLKTQGSVTINMGIKSNKTDNPALMVSARRKTYFDFDQKIQATVTASVGDKMRFNMTYNTDATFEFDNKNLKLAYEGKEDEIIKNLEAGNVSMTTGSSLIRGSAALFGIKAKLQFGKLTATALVSQQNSESQTVNSKGGSQSTPFYITADAYDQNKHFFLGHFFRENYDAWCSKLPLVASGVEINRIEVWVTNKRGNYNESRNLVAFMDVGENKNLLSDHWVADPSQPNPSNTSNNELTEIKEQYPEARYISQMSTALEPLQAYGIEGGRDYEKLESARLLQPSEYTLNSSLGYISLNTALNADEVLAVAYQYTYRGRTYQVGEFSGDITSTDQSLYVKMLKSTTVSPKTPMWHLMMKNVYSLGTYQVQEKNFKLNVKYLSDTTGTQLNYIPAGNINGVPLIKVLNLDRLDANKQFNPDGRFDYIEGCTVVSSKGRVIFPVVEPFGRFLASAIGNESIAKNYVYTELYDSTLTIARQYQDKNKFILQGEYQASSGNTIKLNAMNVPRGSVIVSAGGVPLTENSDYTVDYNMGTVTITNQSLIDAGTNISVSLENQSTFSMQRKTLLGLDLDYAFNKDFHIGGTIMHYGEKALTEKVSIGDELVKNTIWGVNASYNTKFMWLTNLLNKIPTVNATAPSTLSFRGEFAQLVPHQARTGSNAGSSYIDDFESTQSGIDLRSPYSWFLASTPFDNSSNALFPEASLSNNVDYGKNRALLAWYYIDRLFTQRNSSYVPGYIKNDLEQLSNPYVRDIPYSEVFPGRELNYGEASTIQTLNLSFYPEERGPYNLDDANIDSDGNLLNPEKRWGGIMRKLDNTNFEQSNIEYIQFWLLDPFLDPNNDNREGGDLYFNLGEVSEDILKDGLKSYENGLPTNEMDTAYLKTTQWGKVSTQTSMTYAFDNAAGSRVKQDVGMNGIPTSEEKNFPTYQTYVNNLRSKLSAEAIARMEEDQFSPFNDPAGDNYHFFRGYDYDEQRLSILERYKHYNGTEGNSLSQEDASDGMYQSSRSVPDVEDINQDNTLNEYERYFQYKISIRPEDLEVGRNYIVDKQNAVQRTRDGKDQHVTWYQFSIPLREYEKKVGSINDFTTIRFMRMFMTQFKKVTHLRFASLELVRGEWRNYDYNLNMRGDAPADGSINVNTVNIEENASREPVNYVLPPGVSRIIDSGQSQVTQLNEQSMQMKVEHLQAGDARGVYRNSGLDLRIYKRLQMFVHNEAFMDDVTGLKNGDVSVFVRLGSDVKNNYYEYEIPLVVTPPGHYSTNSTADRMKVWPEENMLDLNLSLLPEVKKNRNMKKMAGEEGVSYYSRYLEQDPDHPNNRVTVMGNPSLSEVRVMMIGVRNNSNSTKDCTVWVDELRVTDFDQDGGWAAKASLSLNMSDIATVNVGMHKETAGFGSVDQGLSQRRLDNYDQYNIAVQTDMGRFLPEKVKLHAPVYYSYSNEKTTPKYNPLDQDVLLKDAIDACDTEEQKDSINAYAVTRHTVQNFSVSGLKFDVKSKNSMPWDPANFTFSYSFSKTHITDPDNVYENTNDYRGSFQYNWVPYAKPFTPFKKLIDEKNKNMKFFREWEIHWLPSSVAFSTNISRYYYEQQTRNETDIDVELPVSVSKNFMWDRQFALTWNFTKSLSVSLNTQTTAHIMEPMGQVNKKLFPDEYRDWKDSVWRSIKSLGTPWAYNQTFTASYKAPFNAIPILSFITANASYNATYNWDRGTTIDGSFSGHTIANQSSLNLDGRFNLDQLYNKIPYLKDVNKRFSSSGGGSNRDNKNTKKPKKFNRAYKLNADTTLEVKHNMNVKKLRVTATTSDGQRFPIKYEVKDDNTIIIQNKGTENIKLTITELTGGDKKNFLTEFGQYATRLAMSVKNVSVRFRTTRQLSLPQFKPEIGNIFGQSTQYDVMAPGLDFAFGFTDDSYINRAKERGWLLCDESMTSPALYAKTQEFSAEIQLEPIKGLKITLTGNRTDNRTSQLQFMYDDMTTIYSGSYTKTHMAIATALRGVSADDGYHSAAFDKFLENIPVVAQRIESQYTGTSYPDRGFINGTIYANSDFNPENGTVNQMGSDVLIPAFMAAYSGKDAKKVTLSPFPSLKEILPNWRVTYDGLSKLPFFKKYFKSFTLTHAYQCTYQVGSYSSYSDWVTIGEGLGFTQDALTGSPVPSSPYNISSVTLTEKFAPLLGVNATLNNNLTFNVEYRDSRTLSLNSSAGQLVEALSKSFVVGAGFKIANFNTVLKIKSKQENVSNDLTLKFDFQYSNNTALIRKIDVNTTQATSGTKTLGINFTANYVMSKRVTIGAYFDHQVNTPLVSQNAYPTTNSNYGISLNMSLAK